VQFATILEFVSINDAHPCISEYTTLMQFACILEFVFINVAHRCDAEYAILVQFATILEFFPSTMPTHASQNMPLSCSLPAS
jgi:hypothetical protein